ncbi:hypothetical protein [Pleionea litopenaei]|uniref:Uncharacterized protein n=1 Tax=Pleionea litopenaei TaxID=3070815 RepID=A0AA51RWW4_9GAMM|nr:hypothetical protein [Pleionea sp. HL-JVS1]WMS88949.1 hypothetical protein Q9312_08545 [Pleionea sp. HL-JVS1]
MFLREMSFQEKSAWIMILALIISGFFYFSGVVHLSMSLGSLVPPLLPSLIKYTVTLVIISAVSHIVMAAMNPKEANQKLDERERGIFDRAGHWSGFILGFGVVMALGGYLFSYNGDIMFYTILATLMLAQIAEYVLRIVFYRKMM